MVLCPAGLADGGQQVVQVAFPACRVLASTVTAGGPVSYTHLDVYKRQLSALIERFTGIVTVVRQCKLSNDTPIGVRAWYVG